MLNLSVLREETQRKSKGTSITTTRLDRWANLAQDVICRRMDADWLTTTDTFVTASGTRTYYLESEIKKVFSVVDQTNDCEIQPQSEKNIVRYDPDLDDTGNPTHYSIYGMSEVEAQPVSASVIDIVSSHVSDTTQTVRITGLVSSKEDNEQVSLNGTTTRTTTKAFSEVFSVRKSASSLGRVTASAGAVTLVVIPPNLLSVQYQPINLWPEPDGVFTILVRYTRKPHKIINVEDVPDVPERYHELVLLFMCVQAHEFLFDFKRANELRAIFENELSYLKNDQGNRRDRAPVIGEGEPRMGPPFGRLPPEYGW